MKDVLTRLVHTLNEIPEKITSQIKVWDGAVNRQIKELKQWKENFSGSDLKIDYTFKKTITKGVSLNGDVLWNTRDTTASKKSSFIILYDGATKDDIKYFDGSIKKGLYLGEIEFSTAYEGGRVYRGTVGFLYQHYGHTNNALIEELPLVRASHAFNGAKIKVYARSLSTGNKYHQENQILFQLDEGNRVATKDIVVSLKLKKFI